MALTKMTGTAGVSSFSRASAMTPVWVSQRAPAGQRAGSEPEEGLGGRGLSGPAPLRTGRSRLPGARERYT